MKQKIKTYTISFFFLTFFLILISLKGSATNYVWPIKDVKDRHISSHFAESRTDHFHNGIDIALHKVKIYPIENGEIIFYYDASESLFPEEFGVGKTIVIQHGKARSYYSHLKKIDLDRKYLIDKKRAFAVVGNTGRSTGTHLHLGIKKDSIYVNPTLLLPVIEDKKPPVIKSVIFRSGLYQKRVKPSYKKMRIHLPLRKYFIIYINTYDSPKVRRMRYRMINKVEIRIESQKETVFANTVDFHFLKEGKLSGKYSLNEVFKKIWNEYFIILGKWTDRQRKVLYFLEIIVTDNSGNKTKFERSVYFR